jgi:hypothetical protein
MAEVIAADYGFTKTSAGQETRFVLGKSKQLQRNLTVAKWLGYIVLFLVCAAPGGCVGGNANSFTVGFFATAIFFVGTILAFRFLGRVLKVSTTSPPITVTPSTVALGPKTYGLKDARDWRIGNSRDEATQIVRSGSQALARDMGAAAAFYIAFSYGNEKIVVARNLSEAQADALFQELLQAMGQK